MDSIRSLVKAMGGAGSVGDALGVSSQTICNWGARKIPWCWEDEILALAEKRGVKITRKKLAIWLSRKPRPHRIERRAAA